VNKITEKNFYSQTKNSKRPVFLVIFVCLSVFFETACFLSLPSAARADHSLFKKGIIEYNLENLKKSLSDGSYRGEEGILRINPEVGRSLGLKVPVDQDYLEAKAFFKKADQLLKEVYRAMTTREKEKVQGEHVKRIGKKALEYNDTLRLARERMMKVRSKSVPKKDERLDERLCSDLLDGLLQESFNKTSYNLRDGLGYFYNRCRGLDHGSRPLNSENVKFVNQIFNEFVKKAPETALNRYDLDRRAKNDVTDPYLRWKYALKGSGSRYIAFLEPVLKKHKGDRYPVDPLLFVALMRQESNFNPRDVSRVGAAGLTQIMPGTAENLGMKNIFIPPYFRKAGEIMNRERMLRRRAMAIIREITEKNVAGHARRARKVMQESLDCRDRRTKLFARYKRELLKKDADDRLDPRKAIEHGFKYFSRMMNMQKGDISLALASYNAGPHRVKQYGGVPPFSETVGFRNRVLRYYRDYLRKVKMYNSDGGK
jgi:Transglycosylase SLT domain